VLLALTFAVAAITLGTGRTNVLQGAVHLVIFAAFLVLALVPRRSARVVVVARSPRRGPRTSSTRR
jgi:hypothetical protein